MRDKLHGRLLTESAVHSGKSIDFIHKLRSRDSGHDLGD